MGTMVGGHVGRTVIESALFVCLCATASLGCGDAGTVAPDTAAPDGRLADAGLPDAEPADHGVTDTRLSDAGPSDTEGVDAARPDAQALDAAQPDALVVDAAQPDAPVPDAPVPDAPIPDAPVPDAPIPDAPVPDAPVPDAPVPDAPVPDAPVPDAPVPDAPLPDGATTVDAALPDVALPDLAPPDSGLTIGSWATIPAGTFTMGSATGEICSESYEDQHQVTLTHGFVIATHEVTQGQFDSLMGYNPASAGPTATDPGCGMDCPVEQVSWHEAAAYCNALSAQDSYAACYACTGSGASVTCQDAAAYSGAAIYTCPGYRLPTEAEWEYAYRAGTTTPYYNGTPTMCTACNDANADALGWHKCNRGYGKTVYPVGQKLVNPWGLYDMGGNVWEWCHDWFDTSLGSSAVTDPVASGSGLRVVRGGSWLHYPESMRAANRGSTDPTHRETFIGFRCVRTN